MPKKQPEMPRPDWCQPKPPRTPKRPRPTKPWDKIGGPDPFKWLKLGKKR